MFQWWWIGFRESWPITRVDISLMLRRDDLKEPLLFVFSRHSALCTVVIFSRLKLGWIAASGGNTPLTVGTLLKFIRSILRGMCMLRLRSVWVIFMVRSLPV